jgi:predicted deacetylase
VITLKKVWPITHRKCVAIDSICDRLRSRLPTLIVVLHSQSHTHQK